MPPTVATGAIADFARAWEARAAALFLLLPVPSPTPMTPVCLCHWLLKRRSP
eukprot:m.290034 g.290034  ORF g.290034 m.290034 type:complete len:52 (+) comp12228_c0_seq1:4835-4990(+)